MQETGLLHQAFIVLHLIGLALGLGAATVTDYSLWRTLKKADRITPETVQWIRSFSTLVWWGIVLLSLSGIGLFLGDPQKYLHSNGFLAKMIIVTVLVLNGIALNAYATARLTTFNFSQKYLRRDAAWKVRKLSFVFGAVSVTSWYGALLMAVMKETVRLSLVVYLSLYAASLIAALIGSLALEAIMFRHYRTKQTHFDINKIPLSELSGYSPERLNELRAQKPTE